MIYFSDFDVGGSPSLGVGTIAVQDFTTGTTTGNQSYTTAALTGVTPNCAIVLGNRHEVANDPSEDTHFSLSIGLIDDGGREVCVGAYCRDAVTTGGTTGGHIGHNANIVYSLTGVITSQAGNGLLVSGGMEINWTTASGVNTRGAYLALAGIGGARADIIALGTGASAIDETDPGFEPDFAIFISENGTMNGSAGDTKHSFGIATNDGTQRCVALNEYRSTVSAPFMAILTDSVVAAINEVDGSLNYKVAASDFDASGFSVTPSASSGSQSLGYLAVNLGGGRCKLVDLTTPTSTGNQAITGAGFTPRAAIIVLTNLEAADPTFPLTTSALQGGYAVGIVADEEWSMGGRIQSGGSPQDTGCNFSNKAIIGPSSSAVNAAEATLVSFDSDGMTLNWSSVQGTAKKGFILFIE